MAGPPTDFDDMPTGNTGVGDDKLKGLLCPVCQDWLPGPGALIGTIVEPDPLAPFVDRQEYDDLMHLYQLARRKVLSQAEEIERLKAADPRPEVLPPDPG
jgi:hypothetical protein